MCLKMLKMALNAFWWVAENIWKIIPPDTQKIPYVFCRSFLKASLRSDLFSTIFLCMLDQKPEGKIVGLSEFLRYHRRFHPPAADDDDISQ